MSHLLNLTPQPSDPNFGIWDQVDSKIMALLWSQWHLKLEKYINTFLKPYIL